jgi:predicted dehydrogenase
MSRLKVAVVGCGHLGTIHARLLAAREDAELVAVVDPSPAARDRVAAAHGCRCLAAPSELRGLVDAAVVASPTDLHADSAVPLLEAGIDLLVEKPVASSRLEAERIVATADRNGRVVAVGHVERFNPAWAVAVARVGSPVAVEAHRRAPFTFRSLDVGVVLDLMIHDIDLVLSLRPGRLVDVHGTAVAATGGHEDAVRAHLRFDSGFVADLTASRIHPAVDRSMTLWGRSGLVTVDFQTKRVDTVTPSAEVASGEFVAAGVTPAERDRLKECFFETVLPRATEDLPQGNAIASEHDDFLRAVTTRERPLVDAASGMEALEVALQVVESLTVVRLDGVVPSTRDTGRVVDPPRRRAA